MKILGIVSVIGFVCCLAGYSGPTPSAPEEPKPLVGIWATKDTKLTIYLGADGDGAIVFGPPPIGFKIEQVEFDSESRSYSYKAVDGGKVISEGKLLYNPDEDTIKLPGVSVAGAEKRNSPVLYRIADEFESTQKGPGLGSAPAQNPRFPFTGTWKIRHSTGWTGTRRIMNDGKGIDIDFDDAPLTWKIYTDYSKQNRISIKFGSGVWENIIIDPNNPDELKGRNMRGSNVTWTRISDEFESTQKGLGLEPATVQNPNFPFTGTWKILHSSGWTGTRRISSLIRIILMNLRDEICVEPM